MDKSAVVGFFSWLCVVWICLGAAVVPASAQVDWCPTNNPGKIISLECLKDRATVTVRHTEIFWNVSEFSGLLVSYADAGGVSGETFAEPVVTSLGDWQYDLYYSLNVSEITAPANGPTVIRQNLFIEVVWPLQSNGEPYSSNTAIECSFRNQRPKTSTSLLVTAKPDAIQPIAVVADSTDNEPVLAGQTAKFSLIIPAPTNARPLQCGLTTNSTVAASLDPILTAPSESASACYFWLNGVEVKPSSCLGSSPNFTITYGAANQMNKSRVFTAEWPAFLPTSGKEVFAFCLVETCVDEEEQRCHLPSAPASRNLLRAEQNESFTWLSAVRKLIKVEPVTTTTASTTILTSAEPADTTTDTTVPVTTTGVAVPVTTTGVAVPVTTTGVTVPASTEPTKPPPPGIKATHLCMTPAALGSAVGVPLGLIAILLTSLIYLGCRLHKQAKKQLEDSQPIVVVREEPVFSRQPQVIQPSALGPPKAGGKRPRV